MGRIRLSNNMVITLTTPDTPELWDAYYDLRWRLLREPWQQPRGSEKDELEKEAYHCIAIDEHGSVIGVGRIHKQTEFIAQIRYMAVDENYQRTGIGKLILNQLETTARDWRTNKIQLNARNTHLKFYLDNYYEVIGKGHTLFDTIRHTRVEKSLNTT